MRVKKKPVFRVTYAKSRPKGDPVCVFPEKAAGFPAALPVCLMEAVAVGGYLIKNPEYYINMYYLSLILL